MSYVKRFALWLLIPVLLIVLISCANIDPKSDSGNKLTKYAEQQEAEHQYRQGIMYKQGMGVPRDDTQAFKWFQKAAMNGHTEAQFRLGEMYLAGLGTSVDFKKAFKWIEKAAAKDHTGAQSILGVLYWTGKGVPENSKEAAKWFIKAAEKAASTPNIA
jgi:TPR repeat protein